MMTRTTDASGSKRRARELLASSRGLILSALLLICASTGRPAFAEEAVPVNPTAEAPAEVPAAEAAAEAAPAEVAKPEWGYADPALGPLAWGSLTTSDGKTHDF